MSGTATPPGKSRRRDKLRKHWPFASPAPATSSTTNIGSSSNPASTSGGPLPVRPAQLGIASDASSSSISGAATQQSYSYDVLGDAFRRLSDRHQQTLEPFLFVKSSDAGEALERSLAAASQKRQDCESKQWRWTVAGRTIVLREIAGKIVDWLDRFKAVGDVVANVDPLHVGLPWAALRFMLEVAVSEVHEMASLLMGCEVALYMINRVKAYLNFLSSFPHVLTRSNFEAALTELYTCILSFLAEAIEACRRQTFQRMLVQVWKQSALSDFEKDCMTLGARVEIEASNCDRTLSGQDRKVVQESQQMLRKALTELEAVRQLQESLDRLEMKFDLGNLKYAQSASFDARHHVHTACHPHTRVDLLQVIHDWARAVDSKNIFWLQGMAGTGKSTISYTFADWLSTQHPSDMIRLGASFFFKRGEVDRGSAALLFPTIIRQLTQKMPGLGVQVAEVVALNPDICSKSLAIQFQVLIVQPLQQLSQASTDTTYIIVVDALDECQKEDIDIVLRLWSTLPVNVINKLRLFITSRPELPIQLGFNKISTDKHQDVVLHDIPESIVRNDLLTFLADAFLGLRDEYNHNFPEAAMLSNNWPGDQILQELADMATPLFIVAATIYLFVSDDAWDPRERLETILSSRKLGHTSKMAQIYLPVLQQLNAVSRDRTDEEQLYSEFRMVVGSIVSLAEPLSRAALAALLEMNPQSIGIRLRPFASVLLIPKNVHTPIRPLHLSFGEYVTSSEITDQPFGIHSQDTHRMLLAKCIRLMSRSDPEGLCENMCGIQYPGQFRQDLASSAIQNRLSVPVQYACRYWTYHAQQSKTRMSDNDEIHQFLQLHFLHWLEALSLLGCLNNAIDGVETLILLVSEANSTCVAEFLQDARRFLSANRHIINLTPLQLYGSATLFAPQDSVIRNACGRLPDWVEQSPVVQKTWFAELHRWEGHYTHHSPTEGLAFSPDGRLLVTTTKDDVVRIWNVKTGYEVLHLKGHCATIRAISFSPDGSSITSVSRDGDFRLWDVKTGKEISQVQHEDFDRLKDVVFSPKMDSILACICNDTWDTVLLWDTRETKTGHVLCKSTTCVLSVKFSPSGLLLAIVTRNHGLELWYAETRKRMHNVEGHTMIMTRPAFSYSDSMLAAASGHKVRLWDMRTGQVIWEQEGHIETVTSVEFSPDDLMLASASTDDGTIRLWDTKTGQTFYTLNVSPDARHMVFSHDGLLIAAPCKDWTVRLFDVASGQEKQRLWGHTERIKGLVFSPDSSVIASTAYDGTVRVWNTTVQSSLQKMPDLNGRPCDVRKVLFSPDGSKLASVTDDTTILIWNTESGTVSHTLEGHTQGVEDMLFSVDGLSLVSSCTDGTLRVWDMSTGKEKFRMEGPAAPFASLFEDGGGILFSPGIVLSPRDSLLASRPRDNTITLWDLQTGRKLLRLGGYPGKLWTIRFSLDGSVLASTSENGRLRVWDVGTGTLSLDVGFKGRGRDGVTLSDNGLLFALGPVGFLFEDLTPTILIGNVKDGTILVTLSANPWAGRGMAFSPDASLFAAQNENNRAVKLWNISTGEQIQVFGELDNVQHIRFAEDGQRLLTSRGSFFIGAMSSATEPNKSQTRTDFVLRGDWIEAQGKRILWLPHEYRSNVTAIHGNMLAIGRRSGTVSFIRIRHPEGLEGTV